LRLRNIDGSFYNFRVDRCEGTQCQSLGVSHGEWGGVAICDWVNGLSVDSRFDSQAERDIEAHRVIDAIYGRCAS
jgi:hypothetical protein